MLDLVLMNKEGLVSDVKLVSSLGYRDHDAVEFSVIQGELRAINRTAASHGLS